MRKMLALALTLFGVTTSAQPVFDSDGAQLNICKIWDGTDIVAVDAAGAFSAVCTGTVTSDQGAAAAHAARWPVGLSDGSAFISPATDRTTATGPFAVRLSTGSGFYDAPTAAQLPSALVGGRLDVNVGAGTVAATQSGAWSVSGSGTFSDQHSSTTFDFDTGAGTQNISLWGLALPNAGGAIAGGTSSDPIRTDPTGTTTQPISAASLPLPTGAATAANQLPDGHGVTIDNATEDAAAASNPQGVPVVLVRDDVPGALVSADGDYVAQRATNFGAGFVQVVDSAGNFVDTFGGSGGTAQADESSYTEGTTSFTPIGGVLNDTITSDPTEDQATAARITPKRAIHVNLRDQSGNEVSVGGGTQYDEDTPHVTADKLTLAGAVRRDTAASGVSADGDRDTLSTDSAGRLRTTSADTTQPVSGTVTADAGTGPWPVTDNGGSLTVDGTVTVTHPQLGGGTEAGAQRVTIANDSTGLVSVDDGGGALTVDGTVGTELETADLDTGAGTDTQAAVGLRVAKSGGSALVGAGADGDPLPISDDGGSITVDGTVTANAGTDLNTSALALESGGNLATLAGAVSGSEVQVDVVAPLPAGTNNIGDVDATVQGQNSTSPIYCHSHTELDMTTATTTQVVALSASTVIYVCSYAIHVGGATDVTFVSGTGTNCGTGQANESTTWDFSAAGEGINRAGGGGSIVLDTDAGEALCVTSSGAVDVSVDVSYSQF